MMVRCRPLVIAMVTALGLSGTAWAAPQPDPFVDVIVVMKSQVVPGPVVSPDRRERLRSLEKTLRDHATRTQPGVRDLLAVRRGQGRVTSVVPLWITNAIGARVRASVAAELARRPEVGAVRPDSTIQAPTVTTASAAEPNVAQVNAPALWDLGYRGHGMVVASMDTGVDLSHPELAVRWRGGANSWYDPNGQHPSTPTDVFGHGTQTMGVMVGGDGGGTSVGVAPDARWIAVKIFNDRGQATSTGIHLGYQWLLDPDGNPATADAPNVVNNSWTMAAGTCSLDFQPDLRNLRAAGIVPVFAAGNYGPTAGTSASPANNPEALAVGSVDDTDTIAPFSSRGPSACGQAGYPQLVAPGTDIRTTDLYGGYLDASGTSLAAPHVAGALALLLQTMPGLTADRQVSALQQGAVDLGPAGADDSYGSGRLDVLASYNWLRSTPDFAVAVAPASATTQPGGSAQYTVTVSGSGGFSDDVGLSLTGLPAGGTATFDPPVVTGGSGTSRLTVVAPATTGSSALTITGTSGTTTRSVPASLTVVPPPDYTVAATPSSQTVSAGAVATYGIGVSALNGFTGDVTLTADGLPAAVGTATFSPAVVHGEGTAQLSITTQAAAASGSYLVTVNASSGALSHAVTVTLVVNPRDFAVTMSPASISVTRTQTATYTVAVSSIGGFNGSVSLKITGLPVNSSATWTGNPVVAPGSATLKVKTTWATARGTFTLKVTGNNTSLSHQVTATLVVR
ncbi:subtilase family protein [Kribbella orskensis]|uniref:Subtilase family protein n=1 Tax=Kribbella orskensis TaxID=2512216 RepID=A0ABY2BXI3_9ACTN|nr:MULTISPECIES: S8 family serine peptidase [Kribbella]TCN44294.1 subtilase family protein [Kribbella sp. VKM Ac-2500]TCO31928.1 subtilase family protein [Kribbella orskensis]